MKKIYDRDLGLACDFSAAGETDDEVMKNAVEHIRKEHPEEFNKIRSEMKAAIKTE